MPKGVKKPGPSSQSASQPSGSGSSRAKSDGPPKNTGKKKKDGGGANRKSKLSKKEMKELEKVERQKAYVAPSKPQPIKPDPLDSTGLAYVLPAELVIVLRNLGKKAVKTREKALDELANGWLNRREEGQDQVLVDMLPVWLSHLPQLLLHASKRIRLAAANVHRLFTGIPAVLEQIKSDTETEAETAADVLGVWALAVHDIDPAVAGVAMDSWRKFISSSLSKSQITSVVGFSQRAVLDPGGLYAYLNPAPPVPPAHTPTRNSPAKGKQPGQTNQKGGKGKPLPNKGKPSVNNPSTPEPKLDPDESQSDSLETDADRDARIRVGGIGALAWVLSHSRNFPADQVLVDVLADSKVWSSLTTRDSYSFGFEQPSVRKSGWRLVNAVTNALKALVSTAAASSSTNDEKLEKLLHVLSTSILHSAWAELDVGVQGVMWQPLLRFLKENPEAWQWEIEYSSSLAATTDTHLEPHSDSESESENDSDNDEDSNGDSEGEKETDASRTAPTVSDQPSSSAYRAFLSFLERGCNGSPVQAYPAIVIVLSTLPSTILLLSPSTSSPSLPFSDLFSAFWTAVEPDSTSLESNLTQSRIFAGIGGDKAAKAFVEAILECVVFLARRVVSTQSSSSSSSSSSGALESDSHHHALIKSRISTDALSTLVRMQIERVWSEVGGGGGITGAAAGNNMEREKSRRLRVPFDALGQSLGRVLRGLKGLPVADEGFSTIHGDVWELVSQLVKRSTGYALTTDAKRSKELSSLVSSVLKALNTESADASLAQQLLFDVFGIALDGCERSLGSGGDGDGAGALILLTDLLATFGFTFDAGTSVSTDVDVISRIDTLVVRNAFKLISASPEGNLNEQSGEGLELVSTYLLQRESSQAALLWIALLEQVVEHLQAQSHDAQPNNVSLVLGWLLALLELVTSRRRGKDVVDWLKPAATEVDEIVFEIAEETLSAASPPSATLTLFRKLLLLSHDTESGIEGSVELTHPLLTTSGLVRLVEMLVDRFGDEVEGLLGVGMAFTEDELDVLGRLERLLVLIEVILDLPVFTSSLYLDSVPSPSSSSTSEVSVPSLPAMKILPNIFLLAHVVPRSTLYSSDTDSIESNDISRRCESISATSRLMWEASIKVALNFGSKNGTELISTVYSTTTSKLQALLSGQEPHRCAPEEVVEAFDMLRGSMRSLRSLSLVTNPIDALLPSPTLLDTLLDGLSGAPINGSLGVVDELAGVASLYTSSSGSNSRDGQTYARYILALLRIISDDLALARKLLMDGKVEGQNSGVWWILRHLLALSIYAEEVVMVPSAYKESPLFNDDNTDTADRARRCGEIVSKVQQIVAYVFAFVEGSGAGEGEWRKDICRALLASAKAPNTSTSFVPSLPPLAAFLLSIIRSAAQTNSYRDCRIVREVLARMFQTGIGGEVIQEEEANLWIQYARVLSESEKSARAPLTGITILSTVVSNLPSFSSASTSSPVFHRLDRYRNELASSLLGIPPSKATSEGLLVLLKLVLGTAPDVESEAEFLPVQRAVNVVKACQKWVEEGDDDNDDDEQEDGLEQLESAMTLTFFHLAPILQNVSGGHWQFIFDVVENNLESSNVKFTSSASPHNSSPLQLLTLVRTLRLITHIEDLASTNKSLRAEWTERRDGIMKRIRDLILFVSDEDGDEASKLGMQQRELESAPARVCRELVLELVANSLPEALIDHETFPKMCHLLSPSISSSSVPPMSLSSSSATISPSLRHDQLAYRILQKAAKKRTEHFILEAGVDTEGKFEASLPKELMILLQRSVNRDSELDDVGIDSDHERNIFVYLVGWMLLFDLFIDTSMKVRMRYIEQLRSSGVIEAHFIPSIFGLLNIDRGIVKAFKLDMWAISEFYVQFYEAGSSSGLQTFAAHLYYRALLAVPSLIYNWVLDCRDRQLSSTVASYTSSYFSPVLIRTELDHVRSPEAQLELASDEDQLKVKVASGVVNEVTASYLVDEQQLEIRLRIPGDWPLHRIEIRDTKKTGVDDNRWRSWILAVQQTIWAQNGRIVDGLALFKKNVTGHFAGQVECAICYSLISVMDGTLPRKPCNTCKNRFHAACLYKWFNSSHSSSCPLCRSDILH